MIQETHHGPNMIKFKPAVPVHATKYGKCFSVMMALWAAVDPYHTGYKKMSIGTNPKTESEIPMNSVNFSSSAYSNARLRSSTTGSTAVEFVASAAASHVSTVGSHGGAGET